MEYVMSFGEGKFKGLCVRRLMRKEVGGWKSVHLGYFGWKSEVVHVLHEGEMRRMDVRLILKGVTGLNSSGVR